MEASEKTYKLFSREGDITIYGKEFVERMDAFTQVLDELDKQYKNDLALLPENRNKFIKHIDIGYSEKFLRVHDLSHFNDDVKVAIIEAYKKQFPNAPIYP